MSLSK